MRWLRPSQGWPSTRSRDLFGGSHRGKHDLIPNDVPVWGPGRSAPDKLKACFCWPNQCIVVITACYTSLSMFADCIYCRHVGCHIEKIRWKLLCSTPGSGFEISICTSGSTSAVSACRIQLSPCHRVRPSSAPSYSTSWMIEAIRSHRSPPSTLILCIPTFQGGLGFAQDQR